MTDGPDPVVVHPWLGKLRWCQPGELLGCVDLDPAVRPRRMNYNRDVEVVLHVMPGITGAALHDRVDRRGPHSRRPGATGLGQAVHGRACSRGLGSQYASESGARAVLLFLDGNEADDKWRGSSGIRLRPSRWPTQRQPADRAQVFPPPLDLKRLRFVLLLVWQL